jgi:trehalose/maltose transport system substrate-binding protein
MPRATSTTFNALIRLAGGSVLAAGLWLASFASAAAATVAIACAAVGIEYQLCREGAEAWAAKSGHRVELIQTPSLANERLALFQQLLASGSADIDVFQIDVIWPGILGRYFRDLRPHFGEAELARHFPAMIENNTVEGELKAIPWYGDTGLLYFRKDLLEKHGFEVPTTWEALARTAQAIVAAERAAGSERIVGFVFQGKAYEGLTCNALEWIVSFGGPPILAPDGTVDLANAEAVRALETAASWIGTVAPRGVLNYAEEEARGVFQSGNAVFMRNWPYAWALVGGADSPVKGRVGVAPLPRGGAGGVHAGTLGGGGLAVSKFSRHPEIAADLVRYLASGDEQVRRAIKGAFNPTIPAAYQDAALLAARPVMADLYPVLTRATARPARIAGPRYNELSAIFWNAVHDVLSKRADPAQSLARAERRIERLSRGGEW